MSVPDEQTQGSLRETLLEVMVDGLSGNKTMGGLITYKLTQTRSIKHIPYPLTSLLIVIY